MKFKKYFLFAIIFSIILIIVSGCSSKQSLSLKDATVDLRNDEQRLGATGITSGEREGEYVVPIALSYDIVLINTGKKELGGAKKPSAYDFTYEDGIQVKIEPNKKLKEVTEEVMGFDIYDKNDDEWIGIGETSQPILKPDEKGEYTFDFTLGALEENPDLKLAPHMAYGTIRKIKRTRYGCNSSRIH